MTCIGTQCATTRDASVPNEAALRDAGHFTSTTTQRNSPHHTSSATQRPLTCAVTLCAGVGCTRCVGVVSARWVDAVLPGVCRSRCARGTSTRSFTAPGVLGPGCTLFHRVCTHVSLSTVCRPSTAIRSQHRSAAVEYTPRQVRGGAGGLGARRILVQEAGGGAGPWSWVLGPGSDPGPGAQAKFPDALEWLSGKQVGSTGHE